MAILVLNVAQHRGGNKVSVKYRFSVAYLPGLRNITA
jgi:hypothetical protein